MRKSVKKNNHKTQQEFKAKIKNNVKPISGIIYQKKTKKFSWFKGLVSLERSL